MSDIKQLTIPKLAAALGGVFVTGIQIYGRLAQQIADAAANSPIN